MADANMKWSADLAIRAARAFQPYDLAWLEEPVIPDDVAGHARVVAEGGVPVASGENLRSSGSSSSSSWPAASPTPSPM